MNICSYIDLLKKYKMERMIATEKKIDKSLFQEAAYILRALSNEIRLCVILQLSEGNEKSVSELLDEVRCEQSLLSYHLTDMRAKGILNCRRSGKNCFYSLKDKRIEKMLQCIMSQTETLS